MMDMNITDILNIQPQILIRLATNLFGAIILTLVSHRVVSLIFRALGYPSALASYQNRVKTLKTLLDNAISILIFAIAALMILKDLGFDITPILTGAGILGLAISFGAQSLVKDLISGFFIIIENQYNVGDTIEVAGFKGTVRRINVRTTVLRDKNENKIYIPNSQVDKVRIFKKKEQTK